MSRIVERITPVREHHWDNAAEEFNAHLEDSLHKSGAFFSQYFKLLVLHPKPKEGI
jgi:hypothetical protein